MRNGRKTYEELNITDDFMFCKILATNPELCKELLELILGIKIRKVEIANSQQMIAITADAKSVRLDVYVEDDSNTVYDIEMQATKTTHLPKRSRYYQGMIDLNIIERGENYDKLKKSFVIFICLEDPFDEGLHIYTFENRCKERPGLVLGEETVKVFINAAGTADDVSSDMAEFLSYLKTGEGRSPLVRKIEEQVRKARAHEEWKVEYMTLQMRLNEEREEGRKEGRKEGHQEGKREQLFQLVKKNLLTVEVAAEELGITVDEFKKVLEQSINITK